MSWNCLFVVVRDTTLEQLEEIGMRRDDSTVSADVATTSAFDGLAGCQMGANVLLLSSAPDHLDLGSQLAARLGGEVVTALFAGVSDTYLWRVEGPGLHRELVHQEGAVVQEEGEPLPEEADMDDLDEDSLFELLYARTGLPDDWVEFTAYPLTLP